MLLLLIILFIVFSIYREIILAEIMKALMTIIHRYEFNKREAYKLLHKKHLL